MKEEIEMYHQMNHSNNMAAVLAEDVYAPELRNPRISGMRKSRKSVAKRIVNGLNRLLEQKR